tara:strand:- start:39 stop:722 length:684 start_codon:yes stop_codon:yes gene_type:complete
MIDILDENENIQFCTGDKVDLINNKGIEINEEIKFPIYNQNHKKISAKDLFKYEIEYSGSFFMQNSLFRKKIIDKVGGFDNDIPGDDHVLRAKILQHMSKNNELTFRIASESFIFYRQHQDSLSNNIERQVEAIYQVEKRYGDNYKSPNILLWSIHGVEKYLKKTDHFFLHDCNKNNQKVLMKHAIEHYFKLKNGKLPLSLIFFVIKIYLKYKFPYLLAIKKLLKNE